MEWDFFISHAWEDKEKIAEPLAEALKDKGYKVWYDEFTLKLGDSLRRSIDKGLANSKFGIVILSSSFFAKEWPQKELDGLIARESDSRRIILPLWHEITRNDVVCFSPMLADKMAISTEKKIEIIVREIMNAVEIEVVDNDLIAVKETRNLSLENKLTIYWGGERLSKDEEITRSLSWVRLKNRGSFEYGITLKFDFQNSSREPLNESLDVIIETPETFTDNENGYKTIAIPNKKVLHIASREFKILPGSWDVVEFTIRADTPKFYSDFQELLLLEFSIKSEEDSITYPINITLPEKNPTTISKDDFAFGRSLTEEGLGTIEKHAFWDEY